MATTEPRLLGGRYELGDPLGYGGMAEVFAGTDTRLHREVAVKVLRADLAKDPSFLQRFRREAQSAAGLSHPNIVGVYDTGDDHGTPFIVMELVEGRTLRDVLAEDGRLLPRRALEITAEIAAALEYSHRAGIVHRDIKPANVMLTRAGEVKVMDFGIARAASAAANTQTHTSQVLGTAQYLSPEQARGEHVDGRSDVYSTGCVLYELLTGVPPFQGESAVAVAYQHVREDPTPPSQLDPELSPAIDAVVLKAMAKNPANRYENAGELRADLDRAVAGRRVAAPAVLSRDTTSALPPASPTAVLLRHDEHDRRGRRLFAYTALIIAVLVVFGVAAFAANKLFSTNPSTVHAPNVIGLSQADATNALESDGLIAGKIVTNPIGMDNNTRAKGLVYNQSPTSDINTKKGNPVELFVSSGTANVTVPTDLVGLSQADATTELQRLKLPVGTVILSNVNGTAGQVLAVSPKPGSTVTQGTGVTLTVVSGSQQVPPVQGDSLEQAQQLLSAAGFKAGTVTMVFDETVPADQVIDENPIGGSTQKNDTTIDLTVSKGPMPTPTPSPTFSYPFPTYTPSDTPTGTPTDTPTATPSTSVSITPPAA